jgi:ADP-ribosylation factor 2-binding protein
VKSTSLPIPDPTRLEQISDVKRSLTFQTRPVPDRFHLTAEEMSHGEDDDAMDECEFEITSTEGPVDAETQKFDTIIGALEDLLMSDGFSRRQAEFCRAKCHVFEDTEENKLEYTSIFDEYTETLEAAMMGHLDESVEGFDAAEFFDALEQREGQLDGDVFDLLTTLTSFEAFKELMLDYKREADRVGGVGDEGEGEAGEAGEAGEGENVVGLGLGMGFSGLGFSVAPAPAVGEEQLDGDERPDLDDSLIVTPGPGGDSPCARGKRA